ncbi:hypothetical protein HCJ27_11510 [Listeria sp. FSL L7-1435]|nr:hypothetical protein [Listeria cossartiae]MBC1547726.1 hypothetical protein [Listeria cossartiae subsp. cossartiae]
MMLVREGKYYLGDDEKVQIEDIQFGYLKVCLNIFVKEVHTRVNRFF